MLATIHIERVALLLVIVGCFAFESRTALRTGSWREAPAELLAFLGFSIAVVALDFGIESFAPAFHEESLQYTGWVGSMIYASGAIICTAVFVKRTARSRIILIGYLGFFAVWEAFNFLTSFGPNDSDNPYIRVSPYRPIWTVLIPLLWMLVLLSPRVKRYCTGTRAVPV